MENEIKLEPGETYLCDPFEADAPGQLFEMLLATPEPHDFSFVEQSDLPKTRGGPEVGDLQGELTEALFPARRKQEVHASARRRKEASLISRVIEWEVLPSDLASKTLESSLAMKTRGGPSTAAYSMPPTHTPQLRHRRLRQPPLLRTERIGP